MPIESPSSELDDRVANHLKNLRTQRGFTLDELAKLSGVSRAMISFIERAESSPTARVLDKLASSLGVSLASLFAEDERPDASPVSRRVEQSEWRDPETGYIRRNLSPPGFPSPIELAEIVLPAGTRVAYDGGARAAAVYHQVWVIGGSIEVTCGEDTYRLASGDCLALEVDQPTMYRNASAVTARYLVVSTRDSIATASQRTYIARTSGFASHGR